MSTIYVTDLDGTLLNSKKEITEFSSHAINHCIGNGMLFSVATARMPYGCDYRLEEIDINAPGIVTNGVFLYDFKNKKYVSAETISAETAKEVTEVFRKNNRGCFLYMFADEEISIYYNDKKLESQTQYYSDRALKSCRKVELVSNFDECYADGKAVYIALTGEEKELCPICGELDKIEGINYVYYLNIYNDLYCIEIFSKNASKKNALVKLKKMMGCDETVVFGDNYNDLSMIEISDRSYAPENALEDIKDMVTAIIGSCNDDGVARFLLKECGAVSEKM